MFPVFLFAIIASFYLWAYQAQEAAQAQHKVTSPCLLEQFERELDQDLEALQAEIAELATKLASFPIAATLESVELDNVVKASIIPQGWDYVTPGSYTIRELKHVASVHHVKGYGDMSKSQLFQAIALPR